ncbi:MAG: hypothetical protein AAFW65_08435 [Pseudomonadota bacterium]
MDTDTQIALVKATHTAIYFINVSGIIYMIWCGITNRFNRLTWAAFALSAIIAIQLPLNGWECVLRTWIVHLAGTPYVSDLYLPNWVGWWAVPSVAPFNALAYGLIIWRLIQRRQAA